MDESFTGYIWALAIPKAIFSLADEISAWLEKYGEAAASPYTSESFGGYSYSKSAENTGNGAAGGWRRLSGRSSIHGEKLRAWSRENGGANPDMSLLDDFSQQCVLMEKKRVPDGAGGYEVTWTEGAEFLNYQALDTSMEAARAEKEGVTSVYSALVNKTVPIEYMDYFRDVASGVTYRVTSNPEEREAPKSRGLTIRGLKFFTAERKDLPK